MKRLLTLATCLLCLLLPMLAQVSNDNEDGVNKVNQRFAQDFVPGQVLVKFKDQSGVKVRRNAQGKFRTASINAIDKLLQEFNVDDMEKLFPAEEAKPAAKLRAKRAPNGTIVKEQNLDKIFLLKMTSENSDSTMQLIKRLGNMSDVEYAEPNYLAYITADVPEGLYEEQSPQSARAKAPVLTETTDSVICLNPSQNPLYSQQYGITQQNIHTLWDKPIINKKRPVIAILDTGVDINHPDLADNIWTNTAEVEGETTFDDDNNGIVDDKYGWNFVEDYYDLSDRNGHGTHCAGIAAAADNNIGVIGANPLALIMPIKIMSDKGIGDHATIARGIVYAAENGADVLSMSFGSPSLSNTMKEALDRAYQTAILVASAGNNGVDIYYNIGPTYGTLYPAAYYLVLGVEASNSKLQRASFSNYDPDGPIYSEDGIDGRNYEVQVPGVGIYSTLPNGQYNQLSGTSMSTPLFAGAVSALQMVKDYPSKDVLYGDLIHLKADFAKIYSDDTPRMPKIDLVSLSVDDNVKGNNYIDGQVDVGETILFTPVLRNTWADATDIQLNLTVDPVYTSFVEIDNPSVPFGQSLSAYGRAEAATPIRVTFANNIGDATRIKFILEVSYHESAESFIQDVYVMVNNMVKISGLITEDRTLTADHVYLINDNLGIMEGAKLTIEPGTRIEFAYDKKIGCFGKLVARGTPQKPIEFVAHDENKPWRIINTNGDTISYCKIENCRVGYDGTSLPYMEDCIIMAKTVSGYMDGIRNTWTGLISNDSFISSVGGLRETCKHSNIINNVLSYNILSLPSYNALNCNNYFNNHNCSATNGTYSLQCKAEFIEKSETPSYLGSNREDLIRPHIYEMGNGSSGFGVIDLSNLPSRPYAEAHGIVWKVVVNGKDAQDEYEDLAPLGVGRHKFEVYFNRPMNKEVAPQISFGVREPYTQHSVAEDGSWNEEGTIYTAYKTINGKTMSDGVNRIYVQGAEDNEFFECPYEKTRFNINIQAAGSMATGFSAEAGLGRVELTWNNSNNDFEDAMGFNIYRYTVDDAGKADTICINREIVDIETTAYTDYDVVPGTTYYYMYKVLSTDLQEYDMSNVVAVTPQTSELGDANGSGDVDVADVITTVNYAAGQQPKPFIFEAADMNADLSIDILDVIGIIKKIFPSDATATSAAMATATYTIENGTLYVESPVALAGVQVQLALDGRSQKDEVRVAEGLNGFEQTSAWLSDNDYLFLAYNMNGKTLEPGKHALLHIGNAKIGGIRLSDANGHNVDPIGDEATRVNRMASDVMTVPGIYDMQGRKITGDSGLQGQLPKGVYIINGKKVVR
ncbi:MAG: S8 family serine peptidase [Bacteroidaceae bacterium]|nr:S8 family serine peptidase [Bacteroidaceae bacterium]